MASYIKCNCDYQLVYLSQTIIVLNGFDNILQHFYYFYNFSLKLALLQVFLFLQDKNLQKISLK